VVIVRYSDWRAIAAIALPFVFLAIPAGNLLIDPADFHRRWIDAWVSTIGAAIGILWLVYALWPSAFRLLNGGPRKVRIEGDALVLDGGNRQTLSDLSEVKILRPWLQHPRLALKFETEWVMIETAYQNIGERKSVDEIAQSIINAARR